MTNNKDWVILERLEVQLLDRVRLIECSAPWRWKIEPDVRQFRFEMLRVIFIEQQRSVERYKHRDYYTVPSGAWAYSRLRPEQGPMRFWFELAESNTELESRERQPGAHRPPLTAENYIIGILSNLEQRYPLSEEFIRKLRKAREVVERLASSEEH